MAPTPGSGDFILPDTQKPLNKERQLCVSGSYQTPFWLGSFGRWLGLPISWLPLLPSADLQAGASGILLGSKPAFSWRGSCFGSLPGLWSPERFFSLGEVLGLSCCQRVEACTAFLPWKTPGCRLTLPPALAPFRIFSFLLGEIWSGSRTFQFLGL